MKKTILLLITVISISTTFAQYNGNQQRGNGNHDVAVTDNRDYGYGKGYGNGNKDWGTYFFSARDKEMQIANINHDYDRKIQSVRMKFFMGRFQKERIIDQLQAQRSNEISAVNAKFFDRKNLFNQQGKRYDDRRGDDRKHNW